MTQIPLSGEGFALFYPGLVVSLFRPKKTPPHPSQGPSEEVAASGSSLSDGAALLEVDPATNYEKAVFDFVREQISRGRPTVVFTTRGSPVWRALSEIPQVKFFIFTDTSRPRPGNTPLEVLVPKSDQAVILSVLDEVVSTTPISPTAVVFDSISDLIINLGFEDTIKFLRQAKDVQAGKEVSSLFIALANAHEERVTALVKGVFPKHLAYGSGGLRLGERPPQ